MTDDHVNPSPEVVMEMLRRKAGDLSDHDLDEQIAVTAARRNVAAAHGREKAAGVLHDALEVFYDVRQMRTQVGRELDEMTSPVRVLRPLTPEELQEDGK